MSTVLHALFPNAEAADAAMRTAQDTLHNPEPFEGHVHEDHVYEEEVPLSGTDALSGMILGGLLTGLVGALVGALIIWPSNGYWFGFEAFMAMFVGGTIFGVVAGAVAGASEAKECIRRHGPELRKGEVMVTCEVDNKDFDTVAELFRDAGGRHVEAA